MLGVKDGPAPGAHVAGGFKRKSSTAVRRAPSLRISSARSLWLESHSVVRICGGGSGRAHTAHPSGCGPARLHGWIAAAMSCLRAVRDAVVVSVSGGNGHRQNANVNSAAAGGVNDFKFIVTRPFCLEVFKGSSARESRWRSSAQLRAERRLATIACCIAGMCVAVGGFIVLS